MGPLDAAVQAVLDDPETPEHYVTANDETALRAVLRRHLMPFAAQVWDGGVLAERAHHLHGLRLSNPYRAAQGDAG